MLKCVLCWQVSPKIEFNHRVRWAHIVCQRYRPWAAAQLSTPKEEKNRTEPNLKLCYPTGRVIIRKLFSTTHTQLQPAPLLQGCVMNKRDSATRRNFFSQTDNFEAQWFFEPCVKSFSNFPLFTLKLKSRRIADSHPAIRNLSKMTSWTLLIHLQAAETRSIILFCCPEAKV